MEWYKNPVVLILLVIVAILLIVIFMPKSFKTLTSETFIGTTTNTVDLKPVIITATAPTISGNLNSILIEQGKSNVESDYYVASRTNLGTVYQDILFDITDLPRFNPANVQKLIFKWSGCLSCNYICYYGHSGPHSAAFTIDLIGSMGSQRISSSSFDYQGNGPEKEYGAYSYTYNGILLADHLWYSGDKKYLKLRLKVTNLEDVTGSCPGNKIYNEYVKSLSITYALANDAPYSQKIDSENIKGSATIGC